MSLDLPKKNRLQIGKTVGNDEENRLGFLAAVGLWQSSCISDGIRRLRAIAATAGGEGGLGDESSLLLVLAE